VSTAARGTQVELAVGEPPFAHLPLDVLAVRKVQCAAPVLSVAADGHHFSEARALSRVVGVWFGVGARQMGRQNKSLGQAYSVMGDESGASRLRAWALLLKQGRPLSGKRQSCSMLGSSLCSISDGMNAVGSLLELYVGSVIRRSSD